jgi:hypothetical protein
VRFDAVKAAAAVGEEALEQGRERIVDMVVVAGAAVGRRVLGSMSEVLKAAAAVVGRRNRKTLGPREEAMRSRDWNFGRCVMVRIEMRAVSSDAMIGGVEEASGSRVEAAEALAIVAAGIVVVVDLEAEADTAELGFGHRELLVHAGCTVTFCSYPGTAQGTVPVQEVLVGILSNHLETEEVGRSCRIVVRCRSSSFPCHHHGDSSERH